MNASIKDINTKSIINVENIIARFRDHPKYIILAAGAAGIALIIVLMLWARTPDYRILYSNISEQDGGAVITELIALNIPYRFSKNEGAIMIPSNKVHETRLLLAQKNLPKGGKLGFELLDHEKFGMSQFSEQVNYQRALEGEIARTIETLSPVKSARVHIAIPKASLFIRENKLATASVILTLHPGRSLDNGQVQAITWLVSGTVPDLPTKNITLVDNQGKLLTQPGNNVLNLSTSQLTYTREVESNYQQRISAILSPIIGASNFRAEVTAQLDFTSTEQTAEQHKPNGRQENMTIRSQQLSESNQMGITTPSGVPGALSNQPNSPVSTPIESLSEITTSIDKKSTDENNVTRFKAHSTNDAFNHPYMSRSDKTINYEVDRTLTHSKFSPGVLKRLSVAVVINNREDKSGKSVQLTPKEMENVNTLVREAVGFSSERGDSLNIVNARFIDNQDLLTPIPLWKDPSFQAMAISTLRYALIVLLCWLAWRKGFLLLYRRYQEFEQKHTQTEYKNHQLKNDSHSPLQREIEKEKIEKTSQSVEDSIQQLRDFAVQQPHMVAQILRQWITYEQKS